MVTDALVELGFETFLPTEIIPLAKNSPGNEGVKYDEVPAFKSLTFVKCTETQFVSLVKDSGIPGLTPYYNHFRKNKTGRDLYLTVPLKDMMSFITIVRSGNENVLVKIKKQDAPVLSGRKVRIIDGQFKGVEGVTKRIKGSMRVVVELEMLGSAATTYIPNYCLEYLD